MERVVTLAPNLTEIVFAAGAGHTLVGVTTGDDYPPAVDTLPHIGVLPLNLEAIAALDPDLVLATDNVNPGADIPSFETLGIPIVFLSFGTLASIPRGIRVVGDLLGTPAPARRAADSLEAEIAALRRLTGAVAHRPPTVFLIDDKTLFSFGEESYIHELISLAGGTSITEHIGTEEPVLTEEYVLTHPPEVILGTFGEGYDPARLLALHPTWDVLPALRGGRVYSLDPDLVFRPGPRLVEGARQMARLLHPALFALPAPDSAAAP